MNSGPDGVYKGSVYTVLPASHQTVLYDLYNALTPAVNGLPADVAYRLEVRPAPPAAATQNWLTVFDLSSSPEAVSPVEYLSGTNVDAIRFPRRRGSGTVVAFPKTDDPAFPISYPKMSGKVFHYVAGLNPSTLYHISQSADTVTVSPATGLGDTASTSGGVLAFVTDGSAPLFLSGNSLEDGTVGLTYSKVLTASGGTGPYTYGVTAGTLPVGLSLSTDGLLSGIPALGGNSSFTVTVTDIGNGNQTLQCPLSLKILFEPLRITTTSLAQPAIDKPYSQPLGAAGGDPLYNWSLVAGSLPLGIALSSDGTLSGVPHVPGASNFKVACSSGDGQQVERAYSLVVGRWPPDFGVKGTAFLGAAVK